MYYHSKALESLSALAHKVYSLDERKEAEVNNNICYVLTFFLRK